MPSPSSTTHLSLSVFLRIANLFKRPALIRIQEAKREEEGRRNPSSPRPRPGLASFVVLGAAAESPDMRHTFSECITAHPPSCTIVPRIVMYLMYSIAPHESAFSGSEGAGSNLSLVPVRIHALNSDKTETSDFPTIMNMFR